MEMIMNFLYSLHFHPVVFVIQLILFTVFHFVMRSIIYDPLMSARNQREGRIQGQLQKAEAAAANAQALKARYEDEMKAQRQLLAQELKDATEQAQKQAAATVDVARTEAGRISDEAYASLDAERARLEGTMDSQAQQLAVAVAQKVVRNSLAEGSQERVLAKLRG